MIIIEDDRSIAEIKECSNCKRLSVGRNVEAVGMMNESRGWFFLCFDCWKPRVHWKKSETGEIWHTPIE